MNEQKPTNPVAVPTKDTKVTPAANTKESQNTTKAKKKTLKKTKKSKDPQSPKPNHSTTKKVVYAIILLIFFGLVCAITIIALIATRDPKENDKSSPIEYPDPIYSSLTGEEISDESLNSSPTFCIQIPNGKDGARPQAGLNQAAIIFEAIAEAGITRFSAIFQNSTVSAIGPIRSLRPYYLEWDAPFDCTIVHAGGSDEAIAELRRSGIRELDENYSYMWREQNSNRGWNNLFTSPSELLRYNTEKGWTSSNIKAFTRLTPDETEQTILENSTCADNEECETILASNIRINFSGVPSYNTIYQYDPENNRYLRSYANGEEHLTYNCSADLNHPRTTTDCGEPEPVAPKVVVAMFVNERKMSDGYHEDITTIGSGSATIFQNGEVIEGTWQKTSANEQIVFRDDAGNLIKFTPGQVWIAAVPIYGGSISFD